MSLKRELGKASRETRTVGTAIGPALGKKGHLAKHREPFEKRTGSSGRGVARSTHSNRDQTRSLEELSPQGRRDRLQRARRLGHSFVRLAPSRSAEAGFLESPHALHLVQRKMGLEFETGVKVTTAGGEELAYDDPIREKKMVGRSRQILAAWNL